MTDEGWGQQGRCCSMAASIGIAAARCSVIRGSFRTNLKGCVLHGGSEVRHHLGGSQAGKASDILAGAVEEIPVFEKGAVEESFDE